MKAPTLLVEELDTEGHLEHPILQVLIFVVCLDLQTRRKLTGWQPDNALSVGVAITLVETAPPKK